MLRSKNQFFVNVFTFYFCLIIFSDIVRYDEGACKRISLSIDFIEFENENKGSILCKKNDNFENLEDRRSE